MLYRLFYRNNRIDSLFGCVFPKWNILKIKHSLQKTKKKNNIWGQHKRGIINEKNNRGFSSFNYYGSIWEPYTRIRIPVCLELCKNIKKKKRERRKHCCSYNLNFIITWFWFYNTQVYWALYSTQNAKYTCTLQTSAIFLLYSSYNRKGLLRCTRTYKSFR